MPQPIPNAENNITTWPEPSPSMTSNVRFTNSDLSMSACAGMGHRYTPRRGVASTKRNHNEPNQAAWLITPTLSPPPPPYTHPTYRRTVETRSTRLCRDDLQDKGEVRYWHKQAFGRQTAHGLALPLYVTQSDQVAALSFVRRTQVHLLEQLPQHVDVLARQLQRGERTAVLGPLLLKVHLGRLTTALQQQEANTDEGSAQTT